MTTVKCNSCNIVIDELLSYVQNKISIIDEETLVRICTTSFSSDEIKNSKSLLFGSIPTDKIKINRKNKGKEERDLYDILNLFKSTEPDVIPVFVARQLEKLPPILFDHLDCTKLLKDLLKLQSDVSVIQSNYVTQDQLCECRTELLQMKNDSLPPITAHNVNLKRGAWLYDSGPMGLSHIDNSSMKESSDNSGNSENCGRTGILQFRDIKRVDRSERESAVTRQQRSPALDKGGDRRERATEPCGSGGGAEGGSAAVGRRVEVTSPTSPLVVSTEQRRDDNVCGMGAMERHSATTTVGPAGPLIESRADNGWQTVSRRRKPQYRYHGISGISRDTEGNFKAADKKVPIFITKVHKDTTSEDIVDYVFKKTKEMISVERISFKQERDHKAFKFFVSEHKLSMFLDDKLWPLGIIFRRFINFRPKNANGNDAVSATQHNVI